MIGEYEPESLPLLPDVDPREGKLPAWAQQYISRIRVVARRNLAAAKAAQDDARRVLLDANPTATDVLLDPWGHAPVGLPPGSQVQFRLANQYFDIRIGVGLEIHGSNAVLITPRASNDLRLFIPE